MKPQIFLFSILALIAQISLVKGYGALIGVQGAPNGVKGRGIGILENTPRDCTKRTPCQQDTSIIRNREIASGKTDACGRTIASGALNVKSEVSTMMADMGELPEIVPGKTTTLTIHQVNADGAGPYNCEIDPTGTGNSFQSLKVTKNVPGIFGLSLRGSKTDFPLTVQVPQNIACSGGDGNNMCMIRCRNNALAGPFGGCIPVQTASNGGNAAPKRQPKKGGNAKEEGGNGGNAGGAADNAGNDAPNKPPKKGGNANEEGGNGGNTGGAADNAGNDAANGAEDGSNAGGEARME
ncbi:hypothetical protein BKA69DRAFT_2780 [Paraphysoderma sedebokerense]|nr:hypothetical protein BKA69DRAFT_2780 [Paraphysoderma sedebokerense]